MSVPIWIFILLIEAMILIECAPKLGHVLFDPLSYEAEKFEQLKTLLKEFGPAAVTTQPKVTVSTVTKIITTTATPETTSTAQKNNILGGIVNTSVPNKLSDFIKAIENARDDFRKQANPIQYLRTDGIAESDIKEPCAEYEYNGKICKIINNRLLCGYNKNKGELKNEEFVDMGNGCHARNERIECGYKIGPFVIPRRPPAHDENEDEALKTDNRAILKLRTGETITSGRIVASSCDGCITTSSESNETFLLDITSATSGVATTVTTDSWLELKALTESFPELVVKTNSLPELVVKTQVTADFLPELVATTESSPKLTLATTKVTTASAPEFVTTTTRKITVSTTESVTTSPPTETTKDLATTIVSIASVSTAQATSEEKSSTSPLLPRILRSVAQAPEKATTNVKNPTRWCVEKGDRIVCYYSKNY